MAWWDRQKSQNPKPAAAGDDAPEMDTVTLPPGAAQNSAAENEPQGQQTMKTTEQIEQTSNAPVQNGSEHPVLAAALAAGVNTAEEFEAMRADAQAHRDGRKAKRTEAEARLVALYGNNETELGYQRAVLGAVPDAHLDTHLARLNAEYDTKFGTSENGGASRVSAPSATTPAPKAVTPRAAADAAGKPDTTTTANTEAQKKADTAKVRSEY